VASLIGAGPAPAPGLLAAAAVRDGPPAVVVRGQRVVVARSCPLAAGTPATPDDVRNAAHVRRRTGGMSSVRTPLNLEPHESGVLVNK
jgi:hypothetical protein